MFLPEIFRLRFDRFETNGMIKHFTSFIARKAKMPAPKVQFYFCARRRKMAASVLEVLWTKK